ncbi:hypothetical protein [Staphylococcus pseudoxylosus]|uniref:hypothetical protein n=1 Tax=Staphylococcus pseudoxylosus TaxID=2282419 RepID=UPI003906CE1B
MSLSAQNLVVLQKNIHKMLGNEIFSNNILANNEKAIMISMEKLIKEGLLRKTNQFEVSINTIIFISIFNQ